VSRHTNPDVFLKTPQFISGILNGTHLAHRQLSFVKGRVLVMQNVRSLPNFLIKEITALFFLVNSAVNVSAFASPISLNQLYQKWSQAGATTISNDQLNQLLVLMEEDPETEELLQIVLKKMGASSPQDLLKILKLCPDMPSNQAGLFKGGKSQLLMGTLPLPGVERPFSPDTEEEIKKSFVSQVTDTDVLRIIRWEEWPTVCIKPGQTVLESFSAFVHELTHFRGYESLRTTDALSYQDQDDYVERMLDDPEGEMQAYIAQYRAFKRLKKRVTIIGEYPMESYMDSDGNVVDRAGIRKHILDRLGYRAALYEEFKNKVNSHYDREVYLLKWFRSQLKPKMEQNLKQAEHAGNEQLQLFFRKYVNNLDEAIRSKEIRIREITKRFPNLIQGH